jgi:glycosyltransferase involved in cell wall biosynthesis
VSVPSALVSVVVPTIGQFELLGRAVSSVLAQTRGELELLVVDDSPGGEVERWAAGLGDSRISALRVGPKAGVAAARNAGIAAAAGEWIAFLDEDDFWAPEKLAHQVALLESGDGSFGYTSVVVVDQNLEPEDLVHAPDPDGLLEQLRRGNAIGSPSSVIARTESVREVGGFDPRFSVFADWDLWLRIEPRVEVVSTDEVLVAYSRHGRNMHLTAGLPSLLAEFRALAAKHRRPGMTPIGHTATFRWLANAYGRHGRRARSVALRAWLALSDGDRRVVERLRRRGMRAEDAPPPPPSWLVEHYGGECTGSA